MRNTYMSWDLPWEPRQVTSLPKQYNSAATSVSLQKGGGEKGLRNVCLPQQFI